MRKYAKTNRELEAIKRRALFMTTVFPRLSNRSIADTLMQDVARCYNKGVNGRKALMQLVRSARPKKTFWQKIKQFIGL